MKSSGNEETVDSLISRLVEEQERHRQAVRRDDIKVANKLALKLFETVQQVLACGVQGKMGIERLLQHPMAYMRLRAAAAVLDWSPDLALPVLGKLLVEDLGTESSAAERINIRSSASQFLYRHFGVRDFDRNKLIEPLREYGIELPPFRR